MTPVLDHFGLLAPFYERFIQPKFPETLVELAGLSPNARVLDCGGGTGRVAQFLCERAGLVALADQSLKMLAEARKKACLYPAGADAEHLPFPANSFDAVLMVDALHHVNNQAETAAELWRVLRPGGRIVIEEPDIHTFGVKLIALAEKLLLMRSHFLSAAQITALFDAHPAARCAVRAEAGTVWVVVEKATFA